MVFKHLYNFKLPFLLEKIKMFLTHHSINFQTFAVKYKISGTGNLIFVCLYIVFAFYTNILCLLIIKYEC